MTEDQVTDLTVRLALAEHRIAQLEKIIGRLRKVLAEATRLTDAANLLGK